MKNIRMFRPRDDVSISTSLETLFRSFFFVNIGENKKERESKEKKWEERNESINGRKYSV